MTEGVFSPAELAAAVAQATRLKLDSPSALAILRGFERRGLVRGSEDGWRLTNAGRLVSAALDDDMWLPDDSEEPV